MDPRKRMTRSGPRQDGVDSGSTHSTNQDVAALSGALAEINVATVLTLFEMERRSGVVLLQAGAHRGQIGLRAGKIVRVAVSGGVPLTGREALYTLLGWRQGRFEYRPGVFRGADEVRLSTSHLLLEAARRLDERAGWAGETPVPA